MVFCHIKLNNMIVEFTIFTSPAPPPPLPSPSSQATRYNYSREEKYSLVEIIGMIKGLSLLMHRMEQHFAAGIRRHIYLVVQQFVQISIRESLRKVIKNKKLQTKT